MKRISIVGLACLTSISHAASFDCSRAKTPPEVAICANDDLSKLDEQLSAIYGALRSKLTDSSQLKSEQKEWLSKRDACGSDEACLASAIQDRLGSLAKQESEISTPAPVAVDQPSVEQASSEVSTANAVPTTQSSVAATSSPVEKAEEVSPQAKTLEAKTDSSWISTFLILSALIGGAWWLAIKAARFYKNMKFRGLVNKNYQAVSEIGGFLDPSKYLAAHGAAVGKKTSQAEVVEFLPAIFHVAKPVTSNNGTWSAQIGVYDAAAFNSAMMHYQSAYQQWKIGQSQFEQQENLAYEQAQRLKQHYSRRSFSVPRPDKPVEKNFIVYSPQTGSCAVNLQHGYMVSSANTEFSTEKCGSVVVDIQKVQSNIISIYGPLLDRIYAGQLPINHDSLGSVFACLDDNSFYNSLGKEISAALHSNAKQQMGKHYKDLNISNFSGTFEKNENAIPVAIVVAKMSDGRVSYTLHDHRFPEIELT